MLISKKYISLLFLIFLSHVLSGKDSITVYLFLLDECRICQELAPEMNAIFDEYQSTIGFIGLFPNFSSKSEGIKKFKDKYRIKFNTRTDYFKKVTHKFEATILPEVIVYNETAKTIVYRGAINDLFYTPGKRRHFVQNHYLRDALRAVSESKLPAIASSQPVGCYINFNDSIN
jgi:peroxiredoxin